VPFEALQALGEAWPRDAEARLAGVPARLVLHARYDEATLALGRLLVDGDASTRPAEPSPAWRPGPRSPATRASSGRGPPRRRPPREADVLYAELASQQATAAVLGNRAVARLRQGPPPPGIGPSAPGGCGRAGSVDLPFDLAALLVEGDAEAAAFWLEGAVRRAGGCQGRLLLSWALARGSRAERRRAWRAAAARSGPPDRCARPDLSRRLERVVPSEHGVLVDPARAADAEASRAHAARGERLLASGDRQGALSELARAALLDYASSRTSSSGGSAAPGREREGPRRAAHGPLVPGRPRPAPRGRGVAALDGARRGGPPGPRRAVRAPAMMAS
jgi:hypothetical protein